jgi:hypothetical protein
VNEIGLKVAVKNSIQQHHVEAKRDYDEVTSMVLCECNIPSHNSKTTD